MECNGTVLHIGHGNEHPLGCVILIGGQCTQQSELLLFHGMEARSHKTNQIEWSILHAVCNLALCCGFRSRGRTRGPISKLQAGNIFCLTLEEMGHPQPPTLINCDISTAVGITNNTVKHQKSRSMEMRFFGLQMH